MKTRTSLSFAFTTLAAAVALGASGSTFAQPAPTLTADGAAGLLGQTYWGAEFGYTHHVKRAPRVLHRYGFISNRPIVEEAKNVDAAFRYNYTRGSALGADGSQHDFAVAFAAYLPRGPVKPFVAADAGWAWAKAGAARSNSFVYLVGAGVEMLLAPQVSLTPFVNYQEAPRFHDRGWSGGAKAAYRLNLGWSSTFTVRSGEGYNIEYTLGVQRRF